MDYQGRAVHRTILAVDVEAFGDRRRTNPNQLAIRDGLYRTMQDSCNRAGIPWTDENHEDRGDGLLLLASSEVPKSLFVEALPSALVTALHIHNANHVNREQIRLRMALHAGELNYDQHGVTAASINLTFRLLESEAVKEALAASSGVLAVITSAWFFEEVVQHSTADSSSYRPVRVSVKETITTGWICLPDQADRPAGRWSPRARRTPTGVQRVAIAAILAIGLAVAALVFYLSSPTTYHVGEVGESPCLCLDAGVHNQLARISTYLTRATVEFLGPYHLSGNGRNWWEIETGNNLCLAASPKRGWQVYAESCQPTDEYEWFDNDPGWQFQNAAVTIAAKEDAWLSWRKTDCDAAGDVCYLRIVTDRTQPRQWWVGPLPPPPWWKRVLP